LSQYYLVSRYPIEYPPANKKEAKEALEIAEEIINFIKIKLPTVFKRRLFKKNE